MKSSPPVPDGARVVLSSTTSRLSSLNESHWVASKLGRESPRSPRERGLDTGGGEYMVARFHVVDSVARVVGIDGIEVVRMSKDEPFEEYSSAEYPVDDEGPPLMSRGLRGGELGWFWPMRSGWSGNASMSPIKRGEREASSDLSSSGAVASRVFGKERGRCARGGKKPRVFSAGTVLAMQSTKRAYHSDKLRGVCERKGE